MLTVDIPRVEMSGKSFMVSYRKANLESSCSLLNVEIYDHSI
jgi:hypothetical protein